MFERFTADARRVVRQAMEEAAEAGHDAILADDLLLAVLAIRRPPPGDPAAAAGLSHDAACHARETLDREALASIGISLQRLRGAGAFAPAPPHRKLPFTGEAKQVLEQTLREAVSLGHRFLGTEHILLALLHQEGGRVSELLDQMRVDRGALAAAVALGLTRPGGT